MPTITHFALALCLLPCLGVAWISFRWAKSGGEVLYATARMLVQLILIGFALVLIFEAESPLWGAGVVAVMVVASALISMRVVKRNRRAALTRAAAALVLAGGLVLAFVLYGVLRLEEPYYQPRIIIPIAGMIFSNAMTALSLAAERFDSETAEGRSYLEARRAAWKASLIPQINALFAVGLVSLPGMMTGQILSGVDPLIAVRYQIIVMAMILQASGYAVAIYLWLHRPRPLRTNGVSLAVQAVPPT